MDCDHWGIIKSRDQNLSYIVPEFGHIKLDIVGTPEKKLHQGIVIGLILFAVKIESFQRVLVIF